MQALGGGEGVRPRYVERRHGRWQVERGGGMWRGLREGERDSMKEKKEGGACWRWEKLMSVGRCGRKVGILGDIEELLWEGGRKRALEGGWKRLVCKELYWSMEW